MSWATDGISEVFTSLDTSPDGLSQIEARKRIKEYGKNRLNPEINGSFGFKLIARLFEPNVSLLLAVSAISAVSVILNNEYPYELLVIIAIIAINASFIVLQRSRSDKFLQELSDKTMSYVDVLRDYEKASIPSSELVPGDIIYISKGCTVPADCRIYKSHNLSVEESSIRGSSSSRIFKYSTQLLGITDSELDFRDMNNMLFMGSTVISGEAAAVVTATGLSTYIGRSYDIVSTARKNKTPMQLKLHDANNWLNIVAMCVCGMVLLGQLIMLKYTGEIIHFTDTMDKIMITLALSLTAMPQGLAQSAGVIISNLLEKMYNDRIVIRKYEKAEAIGATQVIITDLRYITDYTISDIKNFVSINKEAGIISVFLTDKSKNDAMLQFGTAGITERSSQYISAEELNSLSDTDYSNQFREYLFYCDVTEKEKEKITGIWTNNGYITTSTGNGINDIIAIKNAAITVETADNDRNIRNTPCDISIIGNHLENITNTVENGRRIFYNAQKLFTYTVSNNLASLLTILIATILKFNILSTIQLLWINLVAETLPSAALSLDKFENDLMKRQPHNLQDSLYGNGVWQKIVKNGITITLLTLVSYFVGEVYRTGVWRFTLVTDENGAIGTTMAFITMSLSGLFNAINMRSDSFSLLTTEKSQNRNRLLYITNIFAIGLSIIAVRVPLIADIFGFVGISWFQYGTAITIALFIIPLSELEKYIKRNKKLKTIQQKGIV